MAFTLNLTAKADVDDSVVQEFDAEFRVALFEQSSAAQMATMKKDIDAESISLPRYAQLALATTPLDELEDVVSEKMVDDKVIMTPKEYGAAITKTKLASICTKGMADRAAARIVGINAGRTENKLAILAMDASLNVVYGGLGNLATIDVAAGDDMDASLLATGYNKLAAADVVGFNGSDYVLLAHDNVIHSLREQTGANSWQEASKYSAHADKLFTNEVGTYKGIRIIRDNSCTIEVGAGTAGIDVYSSYLMGFNAIGKAVSKPIEMVATGPFDKLNRFVNLGHHGIYEFKIVEDQALQVFKTSVSV